MKILQVVTELRPAGAERVLVTLCRGLKAAGHEIMVVALKPLPEESVIMDELKALGIEARSLELTPAKPWHIFSLRRIIREFKPDLVHSHLIHANLAARLNSLRRKYPLVNTVHIAERRPGKWWHFLSDRLTASLCDVQTAVSLAVRNFHANKTGAKPETMPVIYNGIEIPEPLSADAILKLRKSWMVEDCSKVIGSTGRLDWQKGYDILLQILPEVSRSIPTGERWGVVIIGEGTERPRLEKSAAKMPSNIKVVLPGFRADAPRCPGAFDLFVMPSRYEGFGLTLAEAMAHGVPVLAAAIDSLPELVRNYSNGRTIEFTLENSSEAANAMIEMAGREKSAPLTEFSAENMVKAYSALYDEQLKRVQADRG